MMIPPKPPESLTEAFELMMRSVYEDQGKVLTPDARAQLHNAFMCGAMMLGNVLFLIDDDDAIDAAMERVQGEINGHRLKTLQGYGNRLPTTFLEPSRRH